MSSNILREARRHEEIAEQLIPNSARPSFHLSPRVGWMNDPNGFSYYQGKYHLFYQYYPYESKWGLMHWGHAVSEDLLHWEHLPAALAPDSLPDKDGCFSGSAVELADGRQLLMYTGVSAGPKQPDGTSNDTQTQCIAVGDGIDYEKYSGNPVLTDADIPEGGSKVDFRDPKMWREDDGTYRCVIGNRPADGSGQILYYSSQDGFHWKFESVLAENKNRFGLMWECPDFFKLDGHYVLLTSPQDKLGKSTAFVGKVGDDMFGRQLREVVENAGIDLTNLVMDPAAHTTLAFVQTFANGDRDFSFYRDPGADMLLTADEVPEDVIAHSRIFHFGTLSMTHPGVREATKKAVACAKNAGVMVSFDPNLRPPLWTDLDDARTQISWGLSQCDVLKIADNELEFMTGQTDFDKGAAILRAEYPNIRILNVTAGADGSYSYYDNRRVFVPSVKLGSTIETTGAGDTFCASVLNFVLEHGTEGLTESALTAMLRFANAAAYIVTTRKGAIRSMPEKAEVEALISRM